MGCEQLQGVTLLLLKFFCELNCFVANVELCGLEILVCVDLD